MNYAVCKEGEIVSRPSGAGGYMHHSRKRRPRSPFEGPPSPRVDEASLKSSYCAPWLPMPLKLADVGKKHGVRERRALWRRQSTKQESAGAQTDHCARPRLRSSPHGSFSSLSRLAVVEYGARSFGINTRTFSHPGIYQCSGHRWGPSTNIVTVSIN